MKEQNIFGTSRLGTYKTTQKTKGERKVCDAEDAGKVIFGNRTYEMSNHLGNVMAIVSDRVKKENGAFDAVVISAQDYYPYGLMMEGRRYLNGENSYRYGFDGMEKDDEIAGENNHYNTLYRLYNPRIGRWLSLDPKSSQRSWVSPYNFVQNNPLLRVDPYGDLDDYGLSKNGKVKLLKKTDDKFDRLYSIDKDGNKENKFIKINKASSKSRSFLFLLTRKREDFGSNTPWGKKYGTYAKINNRNTAYRVFKFISDNSKTEWALQEYSGNRFLLSTFFDENATASPNNIYSLLDLRKDIHSHPGISTKDDVASGYDQHAYTRVYNKYLNKSKTKYIKLPLPKFYIYRPTLRVLFEYDSWNKRQNVKKVTNSNDL